jgi:outer membrane protein assembly factor BamB
MAFNSQLSAQAGAITSWVSATDNLQHVAYIGQNGHVYELYMRVGQQPWRYDDLTAISGAPHAQGGALTSWLSATDNNQHVVYIGHDQHLYVNFMRVGQQPWQFDDLTAISGCPPALLAPPMSQLTSWVSASDNLQHVAYLSSDQIYEVFKRVGGQPWSYAGPSLDAGAIFGVASSALTSWVSPADNVQHIACDLWQEPGELEQMSVRELLMPVGEPPWTSNFIAFNDGDNVVTALTSWVSVTDQLQHIAYIRTADVIENYTKMGSRSWSSAFPTLDSGSPPAANYALTSWVSATDNLQHMAYIGQDNHVYELYAKVGVPPWNFDDITLIASQ